MPNQKKKPMISMVINDERPPTKLLLSLLESILKEIG
jgi:hypothetical protein